MGEASALVLAVGLLFAPTARTQTQLRAQTRSRDTIDDPFKRIESVIDVRVEPVF